MERVHVLAVGFVIPPDVSQVGVCVAGSRMNVADDALECIVCHIHPGTSYANAYLGYIWWDNESDGEHMYPFHSHKPTPGQESSALIKNPEAAQLKGLWGNLYPD